MGVGIGIGVQVGVGVGIDIARFKLVSFDFRTAVLPAELSSFHREQYARIIQSKHRRGSRDNLMVSSRLCGVSIPLKLNHYIYIYIYILYIYI